MTTLQSYQLWIGLGFAVVLVGFFMAAFFLKDKLSHHHYVILRYLAALCAGFAGALITGEALFTMDTTLSDGTKLGLSGSAGFAALFAIWFTFPKPPPEPEIKLNDGVVFSVPPGWSFKQTADTLAQRDKMLTEFVGFKPAELHAKLKGAELETKTIAEALTSLRLATETQTIRPYDVRRASNVYQLVIR